MTLFSPFPHRHRTTGVVVGAVAGLCLAVAAPLAASAHIHVTPSSTTADEATTLTFSFSHGCDDSPTTALIVDIPDGVTNVVPVAAGGWIIQRVLADNGTVTSVTYTAAEPIASGLKGAVALEARFDAALVGADVAFPVTQECATGATAWTETAAEGQDEPEAPAPVVTVDEAAPATDPHGGGAATAHHEGASTADAAPTTGAATTASLWLGGASLAVAMAAVGIAGAALRRRRP